MGGQMEIRIKTKKSGTHQLHSGVYSDSCVVMLAPDIHKCQYHDAADTLSAMSNPLNVDDE